MLKRFLLTGAFVGLAIPALLLALAKATGALFGWTQVLLWPSSLILMATERPDVEAWPYMTASIAINCLWYALIAAVCYSIYACFTWAFGAKSRGLSPNNSFKPNLLRRSA